MTESVSFELKRADLYRHALLQFLKPATLRVMVVAVALASLPKLAEGVTAYLLNLPLLLATYPLVVGAVVLVRAPRYVAFLGLGPNRVSFDESGYRIESTGRLASGHWYMLAEIAAGSKEVLFKFDALRSLRIPRHAFASADELARFVARANELRAQASQDRPAPQLSQEAPLAQAQYELTRALAAQALRERATGNRRMRLLWILSSLAFAALSAYGGLSVILMMFVAILLTSGGVYLIFIRITLRMTVRSLSDKTFGLHTLEFGTGGVTERLPWSQSWLDWRRIREIRETRHFVILAAINDVKMVPKTSFGSATGAADFAQLARKLHAEAKSR